MEPTELRLYPKQALYLDVLRNSTVTGIEQIFLIGPVASAKTFAMAYGDVQICYQFPETIIPVGRKDMSEAQIGTFVEYLNALAKSNFVAGVHYRLRQAPNDLRITFLNGSIIQFIGMNKSRDPDWAKLKITATKTTVDEVDDIDKGGYTMLHSRGGRHNDHGQPRCITSACNPNDAWTKRDIYLPWLKRIGRRPENMEDQEWDEIEPLDPTIEVIEFTMEDSPLYASGHYTPFLKNPKAWVERFLRNNWNYFDDSKSLFKQRAMDMMTISDVTPGEKYMGVDAQAGGKDRACIAVWEDDTLVRAEVYTTAQLEALAVGEERDPYNYGAILGRLTIQIAVEERVPDSHIAGDVVGVGQGWLTHMLANSYSRVLQFNAGSSPYQTPEEEKDKIRPPYDNLRSQMFSMWAAAITERKAFFYKYMSFLSQLKKELMLHEGETAVKVFALSPKKILNIMLGASPDIADGAMMGYYARIVNMPNKNAVKGKVVVGQTYDEMYNDASDF